MIRDTETFFGKNLSDLRIAIVHEWLITFAGSERVLEQMLEVFPQADLFTVIDFLPETDRSFLKNRSIRTSFVQRLPFARKKHQLLLPCMPLAVEQFDLSDYDLVISSSHAVAKGVITGPDQLHVCMCYSPIRYAWDMQHQYLRESGLERGLKSWLARYTLHRMRQWDYRTAQNVDHFIAISDFIRRRIWKAYRREATVIYPPVDTDRFQLHEEKEDFYLTVSRLAPYKRVDLIVEAFTRMPDRRLVVIGDGPELARITALAGKNIEILGFQPLEVVRCHLERAKAFVFAALEDFGIAPLEAQACGTPVIAYGRGGALETICDWNSEQPTGLFFPRQEASALVAAVNRFEQLQKRFSAENCRRNALRFSIDTFRSRFSALIQKYVDEFPERDLPVEKG